MGNGITFMSAALCDPVPLVVSPVNPTGSSRYTLTKVTCPHLQLDVGRSGKQPSAPLYGSVWQASHTMGGADPDQ